jgi:hypothetical protein
LPDFNDEAMDITQKTQTLTPLTDELGRLPSAIAVWACQSLAKSTTPLNGSAPCDRAFVEGWGWFVGAIGWVEVLPVSHIGCWGSLSLTQPTSACCLTSGITENNDVFWIERIFFLEENYLKL